MSVILALIKKIWWSTVCAFLHDKNSEVISSPVNHWAQISKDQCHTKSIFRSQIKWFANLWFKMKCSPESRTVSVLDLRVLISHMNIVKLPLPVSVVGYLQSRLDLKETGYLRTYDPTTSVIKLLRTIASIFPFLRASLQTLWYSPYTIHKALYFSQKIEIITCHLLSHKSHALQIFCERKTHKVGKFRRRLQIIQNGILQNRKVSQIK